MKKLIYTLVLLFVVFSACRKDIEREVKEVDSAEEVKCYNEEFDAAEVGLDCGGELCEPCEANPAPCSNPEDQAYLESGFSYATLDITSTSIDTTSSGKMEFYAYLEGSTNNYLKFSFPYNGKPDITKTYRGNFSGGFLSEDEVYITHYDFGNESGGEGDVYVTYENGVYRIESCDYMFFYGFNETVNWFNVTFD